jgi:hypothetical protein
MKMRLLGLMAALALCAACTKPNSVDAAAQDATPVAAPVAEAPPSAPAAPVQEPQAGVIATPENPEDVGRADPAPASTIAVGEPNPGAPSVVDASCKTDADCAIKDVGSCCGYRPACVNKASPTFPEQVQAACAKDGRMGICGFPAISGCKCTAGKCEGTGAGEQVR